HEYLANIEKLIKNDIPKVWLKDFKPDPTIKAEPINQGGNRGQRGQRPSNKSEGGKAGNVKSSQGSSRGSSARRRDK
ncbi:MAG: ATP-dependent helicase RhlE, partial [Campylobacterota bacterium]|nr:ATP-dependent helicase RhlE [Campylobacterota bacterium]